MTVPKHTGRGPVERRSMSVDTKAQVNAAVQLLKGVADPTRLKVLLHVQDGGKNVTEICDMLGMSQPAVSHHLSIMRLTGLL